MIRIDANIKIEDAQSARILAELAALKELMMSQSAKLEDLRMRLDTATSAIAAQLQSLRDKIADGSVSDADLEKFDASIATLEQMGKDPDIPV